MDQAALLHSVDDQLAIVLAWLESHALVFGADQQIINLRKGRSRLAELRQQLRQHVQEAEEKAREESACHTDGQKR